MNLREQFQKLHPVPDCVYWCEQVYLYGLKVPAEVGTDTWIECYGYNSLWQGFQFGHAAGLEQQAKRIIELEASLADAIEAQQVMGLKLAHAEGHSANTVGGPTTVQGWPMPQVEPASDHDKIVSWNWVLRSIENNPDHAVIISRTPVGLCFTHGNPVPELEDANELLRDALKELVELKDMKEILDANESTPLKVWSIEEEYRERKPKAWALARAVLNDTNPVMDAAPACEPERSVSESIAAGHPCFDPDGPPDHDWKYVDDSFAHEFGTEICGHYECARCDASKPE